MHPLIGQTNKTPVIPLRGAGHPQAAFVQGIGEAGTIAVAPAIVSAIEEALSPWNVRLAEAPVSPVRLFELMSASVAV